MWRYGDPGSMRSDKRRGLGTYNHDNKRGRKFGFKGGLHGVHGRGCHTNTSSYRKQSIKESNSSRSSSFKSSFRKQYSFRGKHMKNFQSLALNEQLM